MCKSQNDWAWYASALEGVATAMIAAEEEKEALAATAAASPSAAAAGGMGAGSASSAGAGAAAAVASAGGAREFCDKAVELYADVFSNYAKLSHTAVLSIEAAFKVARYFAKVPYRPRANHSRIHALWYACSLDARRRPRTC